MSEDIQLEITRRINIAIDQTQEEARRAIMKFHEDIDSNATSAVQWSNRMINLAIKEQNMRDWLQAVVDNMDAGDQPMDAILEMRKRVQDRLIQEAGDTQSDEMNRVAHNASQRARKDVLSELDRLKWDVERLQDREEAEDELRANQ